MLDQLFDIVKQFGQETVVNNPQVPNEKNNEVMAEATNTVASGLQNIIAGGGLQNIIQMFTGGGSGQQQSSSGIAGLMKNPIVSMMAGHLMKKLISSHGLNSQAASGVASSLIPNILSGLIQKTNSGTGGFDLQSLIANLAGGSPQAASSNNSIGGIDIGGLLGRISGGDVDGDGDVDMQDMIARFTGQAQQNIAKQQSTSGGGIMDMIKGFMN